MPTDPSSSGTPLGFWTGLITQHYYSHLLARMQEYDLQKWFYVLLTVHDSKGAISQQELADSLLLDKVTVVRAIDHLSERGFVQRLECPGDRRKHLLKTLPKANAVVKRIRTAFEEVNALALEGLTMKERKVLLAQLTRINGALSQRTGPTMRITYSKKLPR